MESMESYMEQQSENQKTVKRRKMFFITFVFIFTLSVKATIEIATIHSFITGMSDRDVSVNVSPENSEKETEDTKEIKDNDHVNYASLTLCNLFKQFNLSESRRITICSYNNQLRVDIRRFVGHHASVNGIWLNRSEWMKFVMYFSKIQKEIVNYQEK